MKIITKQILSIAAVACIGTMAHAQKVCNLGLTLVSPANNQSIPFTDANNEATKVYIKFNIKNNGTAAIVPTDTIFYVSEFSGTVRYTTGQSIAANATVLVEPGIYINNTATTQATQDYCLKLFPQKNVYYSVTGNDTTWAGITYSDTDTTNDRSCSSITLKTQGSTAIYELGKSGQSLNVYPNPANSVLKFDVKLDKATTVRLSLKDITGREILSKNFDKVQSGTSTLDMDVQAVTNGLYMIELIAGDEKATGKVEITH